MDILRAALIGFEQMRAQITERIAAIKKQLRARSAGGGGNEVPLSAGREPMSATARRKIAAAQKKRWAAYRKSKT